MNETTPFFQSWGFWFILGLFIGAIVGFFTAAMCAVSGQTSRDEERWEEDALAKEHENAMEVKRAIKFAIKTQGNPRKA